MIHVYCKELVMNYEIMMISKKNLHHDDLLDLNFAQTS